MKAPIRALLTLAVVGAATFALAQTDDTLRIYLVDVEGGNATLFVSPSGESMLMDTGNGGENADRDVGRIMAAVGDAGLQRIDHMITTHWHGDHYGGLEELATRIPIRHYIDHGPTADDREQVRAFIGGPYRDLYGAARRTVVVPGDTVPLNGVDVQVMVSAGQVLERPLPGAGDPNPHCAEFERQAEDLGDNAQSVGVHLAFGQFRGLHLGDLTANKEFELMCPTNPNRCGRSVYRVAPRAGRVGRPGARARHRAARGDHEQRHTQGGRTQSNDDAAHGPTPSGFVAAPLLASGRSGVHGAWPVHRQPRR